MAQTGRAPLQLRGSLLRTVLENSAVPLDQLYERLGLRTSAGWLADVLDGHRDATTAELARLSAHTRVPMAVLAGVVEPERNVAVALRAGLLDSPSELDSTLQRTRKLLEHFRLLASWYPELVNERLQFGKTMTRTCSRERFIKNAAKRTAQNLRAVLKISPTDPIGDLVSLVESFGVPVTLTELSENVHGITMHEDFDGTWRAVILVNCKDSWARQRYTLAHELAHVLFRDAQQVIIDDKEEFVDELDLVEYRAECFARHFLAPDEAVESYAFEFKNSSVDMAVAHLMLDFGISRLATIRALVDSSHTSFDELRQTADSETVRDLMARTGLGRQWMEISANEHQDGASPWLLQLALQAYQDEYVASQVVADVLGRSHDTAAVETELMEQGWSS